MPPAARERPGRRFRWRGPLLAALLAGLVLAAGCAAPPEPPVAGTEPSRLPTTTVVLPNGFEVEAELAVTSEEQARGLMFREEVPVGQGMLFVGRRSSRRSFWMFQCRIPLDMIWLDGGHRIVEIVREAPPCRDPGPGNCPSYGGNVNSVYVLELGAGQADAQGLRLGDALEF